jgi:hypothetical protein
MYLTHSKTEGVGLVVVPETITNVQHSVDKTPDEE